MKKESNLRSIGSILPLWRWRSRLLSSAETRQTRETQETQETGTPPINTSLRLPDPSVSLYFSRAGDQRYLNGGECDENLRHPPWFENIRRIWDIGEPSPLSFFPHSRSQEKQWRSSKQKRVISSVEPPQEDSIKQLLPPSGWGIVNSIRTLFKLRAQVKYNIVPLGSAKNNYRVGGGPHSPSLSHHRMCRSALPIPRSLFDPSQFAGCQIHSGECTSDFLQKGTWM